MKRTLLLASCSILTAASFGQAQLVLNNDVRMVIDGGAWVVVENPATNAIVSLPSPSTTGGAIISEGEFDQVRWQIGTSVPAAPGYILPFVTPSGVKMPLTYLPTTAGSAGGSVVFATYNYGISAPTWNNFNYRPSDVTHMNNYTTGTGLTPGATNESGHVVDRFWIMDTKRTGYSYATSPAAVATFVYDRNEVTAGNTIVAGSTVYPQRFNNTTNRWGDYLPTGGFTALSPGPTQNTSLTSAVVPAAQWFRSWTLSDASEPLPIELTAFDAQCQGTQVVVTWTTVTEHDNAYFTVEKSFDGLEWFAVGTVEGAGTSIETNTYSFVDMEPARLAYYRLVQTDLDGGSSVSATVVTGCEADGGIQIVSAYDDGETLNVLVSSSFDAVHDVALIDVQGKILATQFSQKINTGITHLRMAKGTLAMGMYVVRLSNSEQVLTRKVQLH